MIYARQSLRVVLIVLIFIFTSRALLSQTRGVENGNRYDKLVIRNAVIIDGKGTPPRGPSDIILLDNKIASIGGPKSADEYKNEAHVIDGTGMYVLPGFINNHVHTHDERAGVPMPLEYCYKLWLACGITTVRDVGCNEEKIVLEREKSKEGKIAAPRIFIYMREHPIGETPEEAREQIRLIKERGGDGVKLSGLRDRDVFHAAVEEATKLGLRVAHDHKVNESDAWDDIAAGTTSIEHWYGIPDAALHGTQNFPYWYSYNNEYDRFGWAGHLWRETDPEKLDKVLQAMVDANVAWVPTFVIYEANRDLVRAMNQPWFKDYLHPVLEDYFTPNPKNHGSYAWNWTTEDEIFWRENYKLWMKAVREFAKKGGVVGMGDDAGFIYEMYGIAFIREFELHQEAGFHPVDIIMNATGNNAKILGMEDQLGRVRKNYLADLIVIDKNPLQNFKYLYPTGTLALEDGKMVNVGGVKWTIKDGIVYHAPTMFEDVKKMVAEARKARGR